MAVTKCLEIFLSEILEGKCQSISENKSKPNLSTQDITIRKVAVLCVLVLFSALIKDIQDTTLNHSMIVSVKT
jgi:hypothetical protein